MMSDLVSFGGNRLTSKDPHRSRKNDARRGFLRRSKGEVDEVTHAPDHWSERLQRQVEIDSPCCEVSTILGFLSRGRRTVMDYQRSILANLSRRRTSSHSTLIHETYFVPTCWIQPKTRYRYIAFHKCHLMRMKDANIQATLCQSLCLSVS